MVQVHANIRANDDLVSNAQLLRLTDVTIEFEAERETRRLTARKTQTVANNEATYYLQCETLRRGSRHQYYAGYLLLVKPATDLHLLLLDHLNIEHNLINRTHDRSEIQVSHQP